MLQVSSKLQASSLCSWHRFGNNLQCQLLLIAKSVQQSTLGFQCLTIGQLPLHYTLFLVEKLQKHSSITFVVFLLPCLQQGSIPFLRRRVRSKNLLFHGFPSGRWNHSIELIGIHFATAASFSFVLLASPLLLAGSVVRGKAAGENERFGANLFTGGCSM